MEKRIVKIFISSTFKEMVDERDAIQQIVFVKIRFWARKLGISVIPIDLRWGITEDDIEKGKLAMQCEDAIKISAPFFIGILGNTYGTDSKKVLGYVDNRYIGKSVTDYEITKGVIETNNAKAIVYNVTYSSKKENLIKRIKLGKLKKQISKKGVLVDVNIRERLISNMIVDIKRILKDSFSKTYADDLLSKDIFFVISRYYSQFYNTFFTRDYYNKYLDFTKNLYLICSIEYETIHFFMYNLAFLLENDGVEKIIYHDCQISVYDKNCDGILKHIIEQIYKDMNRYYYSCGSVYEDFLTSISEIEIATKYIIFIDSLDILEVKEADKLINLLKKIDRKNIKFIISDYYGSDFYDDLKRVNILELSKSEASEYIQNYLYEYKKDNNKILTEQIIEHLLRVGYYDISFLQLILNEVLLRGCPSDRILEEIDIFTDKKDKQDIIKKILLRIFNNVRKEEKFYKVIKNICICLSLAEEYLTEMDLENLISGLQLNNLYVTESLELLNELLIVNGERYCFRYSILKNIINDMFLIEKRYIDKNVFGKYFFKGKIMLHNVIEYIGYLRRHFDVKLAIDYVVSENVYELLYVEDVSRLYTILGKDPQYTANKILQKIKDAEDYNNQLRFELLVDYLINCGDYHIAYSAIMYLIKRKPEINTWLIKMGYLERENGHYNAAIDILEEAIKKDNLLEMQELQVYDYLSYCYGKRNNRVLSIKYAKCAINIRKNNLNKYEFDLPVSLNSLAYNFYRGDESTKAIPLYEEACEIRIKYLGANHPRVANNMNNIGQVYLRNRNYEKAYKVFIKSYTLLKDVLGDEHNYSLICKLNCILCEFILNIKSKEFLLDEIKKIRPILKSRMGYNDYLAYADCILAVLRYASSKDISIEQLLKKPRNYFMKIFGKESFEVRAIDTVIKNMSN